MEDQLVLDARSRLYPILWLDLGAQLVLRRPKKRVILLRASASSGLVSERMSPSARRHLWPFCSFLSLTKLPFVLQSSMFKEAQY